MQTYYNLKRQTQYARTGMKAYMEGMKVILMILLAVDMLAVVVVMLVGALGMANLSRNPQTSNKLMRWRVMLQAVAIGLVVLLMLLPGR
jgi:phosphatidylserine synthase